MNEEMRKALEELLTKHKEGMISPEQLKAEIEKLESRCIGKSELTNLQNEIKEIRETLKTQGENMSMMQKCQTTAGNRTVGEQIKAFVENPSNIEAGMSEKRVATDIHIKDASTMFTTNAKPAIDVWNTEVEQTIHDSPTEEDAIFSRLVKGTIASPKIEWVNRVNGEGGAEWTAEGGLKPLKDWEYETESSEAKKIAVATKVSTEMLKDAPFMRSEIQMLLRKDLLEKVNESLLTGAGDNKEILGVTTDAAGYTITELNGKVEMPNYGDVVRASILQMRLLNFKPNTLFINPTDKALIDLSKDTTGHYLASELNALIRGITIVETANIEKGKFLLMDTARWYVRVYEQLNLSYGWEHDDFRKNLVTVIAEMRLLSYQHSVDKGSVIYDSFDTVMDAIAKN